MGRRSGRREGPAVHSAVPPGWKNIDDLKIAAAEVQRQVPTTDVSDGGHWPMLDNPVAVEEPVAAFLRVAVTTPDGNYVALPSPRLPSSALHAT